MIGVIYIPVVTHSSKNMLFLSNRKNELHVPYAQISACIFPCKNHKIRNAMQNFEYANTFTKFQSVFELQP
jgi:hypothetical protein